MYKQINSIFIWLLIALAGLNLWGSWPLLAAPTGQAEACAEVYTVQVDDWLSKIADKFLGEVLAFPAIFAATNQQHTVDPTFARIENPDLIEAGWQLCIPSPETAQAILTQATAAPQNLPLESTELTVFAAASLTEAFTEVGQNFAVEHPNVTVSFNFAGSQELSQQLGQGAPADVFASANASQMDTAIAAGRVSSGSQHTFAHNRLVVVYPRDNPAGLTTLQDLAQSDLLLILAAPEVPVGRYSLEFLDKARQDLTFGATFKDQVLNNVVSYEKNVKAVLTKVALGEGDAGIVYSSDVTPEMTTQVGQLDIPAALNTTADYPIAVVSDNTYPLQAQAFVAYVLAPAGQDILAKYGFVPVSDTMTTGPLVKNP
jgi:molybdate transport system substrate-binding protein